MDVPHKLLVDCTTREEKWIPLSKAELKQLEKDVKRAAEREPEPDPQDQAAALIEKAESLEDVKAALLTLLRR